VRDTIKLCLGENLLLTVGRTAAQTVSWCDLARHKEDPRRIVNNVIKKKKTNKM
jgi:hypothetical protein